MAMKRVVVDGRTLNKRTSDMLKRAEARLGYPLTVVQGSYNAGGVAASAGTHDGGGALDVHVIPGKADEIVRALREVGFAAWHRLPNQGPWSEHIHAIAIGDPELSTGARAQVIAYYNNQNGLANHAQDDGPRLHPIPTWPVPLGVIDMSIADKAFRADKKRKTIAVKKIQRLLNKRLGTNLAIDGIAGPQTKAAYKRWEDKVKAPANDGIPSPGSLRKLAAGYYRVKK